MASSSLITKATEILVGAHTSGKLVTLPPDVTPADLDTAREIQNQVAKTLAGGVAGWKVGFSPEGVSIGAPLLASLVGAQACDRLIVARDSGGVGVEVEVGCILKSDLPPRPGKPYTREEIVAAIGRVFAGIELVAARLVQNPQPTVPAAVADLMANGAYIAGSGTDDWKSLPLDALQCVVELDGAIVHDKPGGNPWSDPLVPVVAYASGPSDRLGGLKAGQIITTGSLCGVVPMKRGQRVRARIDRIGTVAVGV
jgi:2-keto-4-pentenoate hydratase